MLADLLPIFMLAAALLVPIAIIAHVSQKRQDYCGAEYRSCFWCGKNCTFHALNKVVDK